jgi:5'-3' exonuclease
MTKSRLTLIIDGNWLLMSRLAVIVGRYSDMQTLTKELNLLMIRSINLVLKTFPMIDNIIFVADGGSWRNSDLNIPEFLQNEGIKYKGNRTHALSEDIDWDELFKGYELFLQTLKEYNINVSKEESVEGDDWCYWWSTLLNSQNTNVIIWSKDNDLKQLVKTDKNKCFTVCWDKENGLTCFDANEGEFDFLFNFAYSENEDLFRVLCNKSVNVKKINPNTIIIDKIVRGDLGDNIMPIILKKPKSQTTRMYRVAIKDLDAQLDIFDNDSIRSYITKLCTTGYQNRLNDKTAFDIYEHFLYNRSLVTLNNNVYPERIKEIFENNKEYNCSKDLSIVEQNIAAKQSDIQDILDLI